MVLNLEPTSVAGSLVILPTYRCTAACQDCCFDSNPYIKGRIPQERILKYIHDAEKMGIKSLVLSGGEAFLLGKDLNEIIKTANSLGLATRIVTNGYWAVNDGIAYDILKDLKSDGLKELNFSTGDFHQEFVPVQRIINGACAAASLGIQSLIVVEVRKSRKFSKIDILKNTEISQTIKEGKPLKIIESPWIPMYDSDEIIQDGKLLVNKKNISMRRGCDSILNTFVVNPSENLGACCGLTREQIPEMNLGSLKEKSLPEMINQAFDDFLKIWIYVEGPEKIIAWASSKDPAIKWENKYAHICHACRELYADKRIKDIIRKYYSEKVFDVYLKYSLLTGSDAPNPFIQA